MKKNPTFFYLVLITIIFSCKKEETPPATLDSFFQANEVKMQTYTIDGAAGGSFSSPQGSVVTIPANAFVTQSNVPVTGNVSIQFKDIYKKSDMILSRMPTMMYPGVPLKSGGEFFIKAISNDSPILLAPGKNISVAQPAGLTGGIDSVNIQKPFVLQPDSSGTMGWVSANKNGVSINGNFYIYNLYKLNSPAESGSWCNSDNSTFFSAYPQTTLTLQSNDDVDAYKTQVFLVFSNITSTVCLYHHYNGTFPYDYAPQGLQCTLVAFGVKNTILYSAVVPITISANQTVNFSLRQTNPDDFIAKLKTLDY